MILQSNRRFSSSMAQVELPHNARGIHFTRETMTDLENSLFHATRELIRVVGTVADPREHLNSYDTERADFYAYKVRAYGLMLEALKDHYDEAGRPRG